MSIKEMCAQYKALKQNIAELETQQDALKAELIKAMQGREKVAEGGYKVSNTIVIGSRFDSKAFKADHPAEYEEYKRETMTTRFTVA